MAYPYAYVFASNTTARATNVNNIYPTNQHVVTIALSIFSSLETCPPLTNDPKNGYEVGEWRNVTLRPAATEYQAPATIELAAPHTNATPSSPPPLPTTEPRPTSAHLVQRPIEPFRPIAPPRRKRQTLPRGLTGGFKDVFGNLHRRSSVDSVIVSSDRASLDGNAVGAQQRHEPLRFYASCAVDVTRGPDEGDEDVVEGRTSVKFDEQAATEPIRAKRSELKRKVSKVGNKKSDKFFGENLSDCLSDEHIDSSGVVEAGVAPVRPTSLHDELDAFVADNVLVRSVMKLQQQEHDEALKQLRAPIAEQKPDTTLERRVESKPDQERRGSETDEQSEPDSRSSLNRKAEFLMTMLENHNREEMRYLNRTPVQEPIIVPKRKKSDTFAMTRIS